MREEVEDDNGFGLALGLDHGFQGHALVGAPRPEFAGGVQFGEIRPYAASQHVHRELEVRSHEWVQFCTREPVGGVAGKTFHISPKTPATSSSASGAEVVDDLSEVITRR